MGIARPYSLLGLLRDERGALGRARLTLPLLVRDESVGVLGMAKPMLELLWGVRAVDTSKTTTAMRQVLGTQSRVRGMAIECVVDTKPRHTSKRDMTDGADAQRMDGQLGGNAAANVDGTHHPQRRRDEDNR